MILVPAKALDALRAKFRDTADMWWVSTLRESQHISHPTCAIAVRDTDALFQHTRLTGEGIGGRSGEVRLLAVIQSVLAARISSGLRESCQ